LLNAGPKSEAMNVRPMVVKNLAGVDVEWIAPVLTYRSSFVTSVSFIVASDETDPAGASALLRGKRR
jgi:hypothetical protein